MTTETARYFALGETNTVRSPVSAESTPGSLGEMYLPTVDREPNLVPRSKSGVGVATVDKGEIAWQSYPNTVIWLTTTPFPSPQFLGCLGTVDYFLAGDMWLSGVALQSPRRL